MGCLGVIYWAATVIVSLLLFTVDGVGPVLGFLFLGAALFGWLKIDGSRTQRKPTSGTARKADGGRAEADHRAQSPVGAAMRAWGPASQSVEVVGEAYRSAAFAAIFADTHIARPDGAEKHLEAALAPDGANPYDSSAVAVWVAGQHVGYFERELAQQWFPVLDSMARAGKHLVVDARIWARASTDRIFARVTLDLPRTDAIHPANPLPTEPHVLLPTGARVQVTQEDKHMDVLRLYAQGGERLVVVTLHAVDEQRARSSARLVEARIDGLRVGVLSSTGTANLMPLVELCDERGFVPVARALVVGNELKADVTLLVARAQDVDPKWLAAVRAGRAPAADEA